MTPTKRFLSTKTYTHAQGLSCAFRQWRADSHCRFLHGYALQIRVEFEASAPDKNGWVVDFGNLKMFKQWLENVFDHKTLVAVDDPQISIFREMQVAGLIDMVVVPATGCERFAALIFEGASMWLADNGYLPRVRVHRVEVREHESNSAIVEGVYNEP